MYLHTQAAPFPALLYRFSTIDLLGALYGGDAREKKSKGEPGTSELARNYMTEVMLYPEDRAELLQKVFRHKIVHLAQPNPIVSLEGKSYKWSLEHNNRGIHLEIDPTGKNEYWFKVSI